MRICHVIAGLTGGPEVILSQLIALQARDGHEVAVVYSCLRDRSEKFRELVPANVVFVPWNVEREVSITGDCRAFWELNRILRDLAPAIAHLHNAKAGLLGRIACRMLRIPAIYSPHGLAYLRGDVSSLKRTMFYGLEWLGALFGGLVVASSEGERIALRGIPARVRLINNGVDPALIIAAAQKGSPAGSGTPGGFRIVVVGRIEEQKNPQLVARLAAMSPSAWEWIWVGVGRLRPVLEAVSRIKITGWLPRNDVLATVSKADVFLQVSRWEGMSFGLLEAMALGRPCVVSNVVGNRDVVRDGCSGLVCEDDGPLLAGLSSLSNDAEQRKQLGQGALDAIFQSFNLETVESDWKRLYALFLAADAVQ